jgi:hypothetical protein
LPVSTFGEIAELDLEILEVDHRSPPWSLPTGVRFTCPACGDVVDIREHGPPWRPTYA